MNKLLLRLKLLTIVITKAKFKSRKRVKFFAPTHTPSEVLGKQEFRRMDFGSRLLPAEGEGGGGSEGEGEGCV